MATRKTTTDNRNKTSSVAASLSVPAAAVAASPKNGSTAVTVTNLLPDELLCKVACFLNAKSLNETRLASKKMCRIMSSNQAGWPNLCTLLWSRRLHVSATISRANNAPVAARKAYMDTCRDAALRSDVSDRELLFDPTTGRGVIWSFCFKDAAGRVWTRHDPWQNGRKAREMVFLKNGSVLQCFRNKDTGGGQLRHPFSDERAGGLATTWRYVPRDGNKNGKKNWKKGGQIRLSIAGRDVPTYVVRRHRSTWGFVMENCWGVFASFPLPKKQRLLAATARQSTTTAAAQLPRRSNTVREQNDRDNPPKRRRTNNDGVLSLSNDTSVAADAEQQRQWREAVMYNAGANVQPPPAPEPINRVPSAEAS